MYFGGFCTAGLLACEAGTKLFAGLIAWALEAGAVCWAPPLLGRYLAGGHIAESIRESGSSILLGAVAPWSGASALGVGMGVGATTAAFPAVRGLEQSILHTILASRAAKTYAQSLKEGKSTISRFGPISRWQYEAVINRQFQALFPPEVSLRVADVGERAKILSSLEPRQLQALSELCHLNPTYCATNLKTLTEAVKKPEQYLIHYYNALTERLLTEEALSKLGAEATRTYEEFMSYLDIAMKDPTKVLSEEGVKYVKELAEKEAARAAEGLKPEAFGSTLEYTTYIDNLEDLYFNIHAGDLLGKAREGKLTEEELRYFNEAFREKYNKFLKVRELLGKKVEELRKAFGEKLRYDAVEAKLNKKYTDLKKKEGDPYTAVREASASTVKDEVEELSEFAEKAVKEAGEAAEEAVEEGRRIFSKGGILKMFKDQIKTFPCMALGYVAGTLAAAHTVGGFEGVQTLTLSYEGNTLVVGGTAIG